MTFKITKKGSSFFTHSYNNGSKDVELSDWNIILEYVSQTISIQSLNGSNIPNVSVNILDVIVIDETDTGLEETFSNLLQLRIRLIELGYNALVENNGNGVPDATTTVKGKLKLAGDLGGTADLPTVPELANKVDKNTAIAGATKTKITYDSKGLVTAGADATTADISDSTNKRYVTDANLIVIGNTSGTNTGDQNLSGLQPYAVATPFLPITFDVPRIFFSFTTPTSDPLTTSLVSPTAKIGVVQKIYVNHATDPTTGLSGWKKLFGTYTNGVTNIIYAEWCEGSRVEYWIAKATV